MFGGVRVLGVLLYFQPTTIINICRLLPFLAVAPFVVPNKSKIINIESSLATIDGKEKKNKIIDFTLRTRFVCYYDSTFVSSIVRSRLSSDLTILIVSFRI